MKSSYIIPNLTEAQKERVRHLIEREGFEIAFETTRSELAPVFEALISRSTFARLKRQLELEESLSTRDALKASAKAVAHEEQNDEIKTASIALLKEKAFQLSASDDRHDLRAASRLLQEIEKLEERQAASRPVREQTEQYRLAIARNIRLHFGEIGSIRSNPSLSEERKDRMVMERIFIKP